MNENKKKAKISKIIEYQKSGIKKIKKFKKILAKGKKYMVY